MLYNLQKSGAQTFLLTNSGWEYTNQVLMKFKAVCSVFNFDASLGISDDLDVTYLCTCLAGHGLPVELP